MAGAGAGWPGAGAVPEVPVGAGAAVVPAVAAVEGAEPETLAALALAELLGSSALVEGDDGDFGIDDEPAPIAAANAVMCVRTS